MSDASLPRLFFLATAACFSAFGLAFVGANHVSEKWKFQQCAEWNFWNNVQRIQKLGAYGASMHSPQGYTLRQIDAE
jgi:hypothetical protein